MRPEARQAQAVETETVVAVRSVTIHAQSNSDSNGLGVGATLGATLGAAIGNGLGGANGRVAATATTAPLGDESGQRAEFALSSVSGLEITNTKGDRSFSVVKEEDSSRFVPNEIVASSRDLPGQASSELQSCGN